MRHLEVEELTERSASQQVQHVRRKKSALQNSWRVKGALLGVENVASVLHQLARRRTWSCALRWL